MKKSTLERAIVTGLGNGKWLCNKCGHCNKACVSCAKCGHAPTLGREPEGRRYSPGETGGCDNG